MREEQIIDLFAFWKTNIEVSMAVLSVCGDIVSLWLLVCYYI